MFRSKARSLVVLEERMGSTSGYRPESRPRLIGCSMKYLQELPLESGLLRRWGYRQWARDEAFRVAYYARMPAWPLVWTLERVRLGYTGTP